MKLSWTDLRGKELSDYAASRACKNHKASFVRHLRKHGTPTDFNNFIDQKFQPVEKCLEYYTDFPQAAQAWLLDNLRTAANKSANHYLTAYFVLVNMRRLSYVRTPLEDIIKHIDLDSICAEDHKILLPLWITNGFKDVVKNHWGVYEDLVCNDLASNPKVSKMYTTEGFDLEAEIGWTPKLTQGEHFINCCSGGLLHRVQQYSVAHDRTGVLLQAFYLAARKSPKTSDVLEYLWDTYPTTPWHTATSVLLVIDKLPPHIAQRFLERMTFNATCDEQIVAVMNSAIVKKKEKAIEVLFPYVASTQYYKILPFVVASKNTKMFKRIVNQPHGEKQFLKALGKMDDQHAVRANHMRNTLQNELLRKRTKEFKKTESVVKRKM